ncbi:MAG TPA: hypothetical protein VHG90_02450 [Acidimicrobiales bacterium]|nr:hypothetical protein [Acidimicrobiales bacterium]
MFVIGVDPHKGSHTAAALDGDERVHGELRVRADRDQRRRLLAWPEAFSPRTWAVEGATATGSLLAQQLLPLARLCSTSRPHCPPSPTPDSGSTDHDARSAAIVALREPPCLRISKTHDALALRSDATGGLSTRKPKVFLLVSDSPAPRSTNLETRSRAVEAS